MGTANFRTMKHFPLYTYPTVHWETYCPDCHTWFEYDEDDTVCPFCGGEDIFHDDNGMYLAEEFMHDISPNIERLNDGLLFHKVAIESGYYTGLQFYVEAEHDLEEYEYDEDDCQWNFDMSRSRAHCMFYSERVKLRTKLAELAHYHGMDELFCIGVFSNGEAVYERVEDTTTSRIRQAVFR